MPAEPSAESTASDSKSSSSCPGSTPKPTWRTWRVSGPSSATRAISTRASSCPQVPVAAKWPTRTLPSGRLAPMPMSETPTGTLPLIAGRPAATVHRPRSLAELREVLIQPDGLTLVPVSGRTQLELGQAPEGPFALLDLSSALGGALQHEPSDLTLVAP